MHRAATPLGSTNPYGRTKLFIEEIMRDWATANAKAKVVLLRYFNPVPLASTHLALPILAAHASSAARRSNPLARAHTRTNTHTIQYSVPCERRSVGSKRAVAEDGIVVPCGCGCSCAAELSRLALSHLAAVPLRRCPA
jgi:hypothetical protein